MFVLRAAGKQLRRTLPHCILEASPAHTSGWWVLSPLRRLTIGSPFRPSAFCFCTGDQSTANRGKIQKQGQASDGVKKEQKERKEKEEKEEKYKIKEEKEVREVREEKEVREVREEQQEYGIREEQQEYGVREEQKKEYEVVDKKYDETDVPGMGSSRKYSDLTELQKSIISSNRFDLADPKIVPKTGVTSSFAGISESITEISLGKAKIRSQHEVFLSEVDPYNIPADLDIRFDSLKEIRIIGAQTPSPQDRQKLEEGRPAGESVMMNVQASTVEHKGMSEFMEKELNGLKTKVHYGNTRFRRLDFLVGLIFLLVLEPVFKTVNSYYWCLESIRQIERQRMKEVEKLKQASFLHVLLHNPDFNNQNM